MRNKGIKLIVLALIFLVLFVVAVLFAGMSDGKYAAAVNFYFLDSESGLVVEESRDISYNDKKEVVREIIKEIEKGPKSTGAERIVPKDAKLKGVSYAEDGYAVLDFDKNFLSEETSENVLAAYTVIKSVCCSAPVTGITHVKITVEGEEIKTSDDKVVGFLTYDDIEL